VKTAHRVESHLKVCRPVGGFLVFYTTFLNKWYQLHLPEIRFFAFFKLNIFD
jgi:hypothetical protein